MNRIERKVMVAGYHHDGPPHTADKVASFMEFGVARALGQITADDHKIGTVPIQAVKERIDLARVVTAKVEIGNVGNPAHQTLGVCCSGGANTRSARARVR